VGKNPSRGGKKKKKRGDVTFHLKKNGEKGTGKNKVRGGGSGVQPFFWEGLRKSPTEYNERKICWFWLTVETKMS